jgi:hypothetical protein
MEAQDLFTKWVSAAESGTCGLWHIFAGGDGHYRSRCGRHETDTDLTEAPGGPSCRACLVRAQELGEIDSTHWRWECATDEG